jgi:hypothetical protein
MIAPMVPSIDRFSALSARFINSEEGAALR